MNLSAKVAVRRLNQIYQQLILKVKEPQQRKLLIDAEQAWIQFRDVNCAFERSSFEGGSIASSIYSKCIEEMTKQRTEKLESYLKAR